MECPNIELSEHHILAQNQTSNMSNITKNGTVCKHRTVHSNTNKYLSFKAAIWSWQPHNFLITPDDDEDHCCALFEAMLRNFDFKNDRLM